MEFDILTKYDICIEMIDRFRKTGMSWEQIKTMCKEQTPYDVLYPEDYKEKWPSLVDYMKKIEDDTQAATGYIYSEDVNNNIKIPESPRSAWKVFERNKLKKFGLETIKNCETSAQKILDRLKLESYEQEPGKGLVMGYVQSGKTMNIESIITMGADIGFNIFVMLPGTIVSLQKQNHDRLRSDIEYSEASNIQWKFIGDEKEADINGILENERARIVKVCLKNGQRLENLKKWLIDSTSKLTKQKMKILIIDDEADQASLNTGKKEAQKRSSINKLITEIVNYNEFKAMNYISYTATPYGNFLNENGKESLYPRNFIISLPKSKQYIGASEIFGNGDDMIDGLPIKNEITNIELDNMKNLTSSQFTFPKSLENAICWFICTLAIQRYRKSTKPVSMLIHTDAKQLVHSTTWNVINDWFIQNKETLYQKCEQVYQTEIKQLTQKKFYEILPNYNEDNQHKVLNYPKFEQIQEEIKQIIHSPVSRINISETGKLEFHKGIHILIDNSNNKKGLDENGDFVRLAYPKEGSIDFASGMIVIGGNTLARGLTIEGLTSSYFARSVSQVDSLMQMGRWFGYRTNYELLPRIWLPNETLEKFREIAHIEHRLRQDLKKFDLGVKPSEYAPKIQSSYITKFLLTSKNKSKNAVRCGATYEKVDNQTIVLQDDPSIQKENLNIAIQFIQNLIQKEKMQENQIDENYIYSNIDFETIQSELLSKMKFYENDNFYGHIDEFIEWMQEENKSKWDVVMINDNSTKQMKIGDLNIHKVNRAKRKKARQGVIDFGILRNKKAVDNAYYYENNKPGTIEQIKRPKLFIYMIDGKSTVTKEKSADLRTNLNYATDIVGLHIYVPNTGNKDRKIFTQNMKEE